MTDYSKRLSDDERKTIEPSVLEYIANNARKKKWYRAYSLKQKLCLDLGIYLFQSDMHYFFTLAGFPTKIDKRTGDHFVKASW